jgi:hypothetical protein
MSTKNFESRGFRQGRLIAGSKSIYRERYPENEIYFNCNIFVPGEGKVWYGDIDVTLDREALKEIANEIGKNLYILREMDGRFENENLDENRFMKVAVHVVECKNSRVLTNE